MNFGNKAFIPKIVYSSSKTAAFKSSLEKYFSIIVQGIIGGTKEPFQIIRGRHYETNINLIRHVMCLSFFIISIGSMQILMPHSRRQKSQMIVKFSVI